MSGRLKSLPKRLQCLNRPNLNLRSGRYNPAHYQNAHPTMKLPYLGILLGTALLCHPVQAVTYICKIDGKAAYSSVKINSSCQKSQMDGISEERPKQKAQTGAASDVAVENTDRDDISEIWEEATYGTYDDIKILPRVSDGPTNSAAPKLEVKLRNQPKAPLKTAPAGPAPIRTAAPNPAKGNRQRTRRPCPHARPTRTDAAKRRRHRRAETSGGRPRSQHPRHRAGDETLNPMAIHGKGRLKT